MAPAGQSTAIKPRVISSLRWWIGGILFASTVINYIDRQTLSVLAPYLKLEHHWTNTDYANIVIAFRVAYSSGQAAVRAVDGSRRHPARTDDYGRLVFGGLDADLAGDGLLQLCRISVSAGSGRIGQLAGGDESSFGMVSETRARTGNRVLRQRVFDRRRDRAVYRLVDLLSLGMAAGIHDSGRARVSSG